MNASLPPDPDPGLLSRAVRRVATASAKRPKRTIALWLLLVVGCVTAGAMTGTKTLDGPDAGTGESQKADRQIKAAGLEDQATESILIASKDPRTTTAAANAVATSTKNLEEVASVTTPTESPDLSKDGGNVVLVQVKLRAGPDEAGDHIDPVLEAVDNARDAHPQATIHQVGPGSFDAAISKVVEEDLAKAEFISIPVTLIILVAVFGAIVAASVPLLLGITSVIAAIGAMGVVSQIAPLGDATSSLVVLIGLAVGVDYSLFYIRREREERRAGKGPDAALDATAATVGRAVVISGLTVLTALAGLLIPGLGVFTSLGLATMVVVLIAVIGSVTVLPAVLALLGDRIDKGRIPFVGKAMARRARTVQRTGGAWGRLARSVTRRPAVALVIAVAVLGTLAVPALDMNATDSGANSLPADTPVMQAKHAVEREFPGSPAPAELVVTGSDLGSKTAELERIGNDAARLTEGRGQVIVDVGKDGRTARISVPMPAADDDAARAKVADLRTELEPGSGEQILVTGSAAQEKDFNDRLDDTRWIVIAGVLALAFILLFATTRSVPMAASVMGLNLLSVGATYGVLTAVFQHNWAEDFLDFTSTGAIGNWIPLNVFVILFGLSMDYTVLVLERIREARRAGLDPREAAQVGVSATAGAITSAAVVMVAIFAIFPTLPLLEMKQIGVALAVGVLLDATIVRGVALPATVALLGERGMKGPRPRMRRRTTRRRLAQVA